MGVNSSGFSRCKYCSTEYRLFTISNRDMQGLTNAWKIRHERTCKNKTPEQRRKWARKYSGLDESESSLTVNLDHTGFKDSIVAKELSTKSVDKTVVNDDKG